MAKLIKLTIMEETENPLTETEKKDISESTINEIKKYFSDGNTFKTNGSCKRNVKGKLVKVKWELQEEGIMTPKMIQKADMFIKNDEIVDDKDDFCKNKYLTEAKVIEYSTSMPKSRSTGFFMLSAYIHGYDIENVEEVKKLKLGEHIDPDILEKIYIAAKILCKQIQKNKGTGAIDNLLKGMYTKDYHEKKGIHLEDKNKKDKKSSFEKVSEWNIENYSHGSKEIVKVIEVECIIGNDTLTSDQRYELGKIIQKECDMAINKGISEGDVSYTFPDGLEVKAKWKINDNKEDIAKLEELTKATENHENRFVAIFKKTSPLVKMGLVLKTGLKLGYEMPYEKESNDFMMGIEPSDDKKKEITSITLEILKRIVEDNNMSKAADIISDILLSINN